MNQQIMRNLRTVIKRILFLSFMITVSLSAKAQKWSVSTNALDYVNFLTFNIQGSVAIHRNFTLDAGVRFKPWALDAPAVDKLQEYDKLLMYHVGTRWYPWFVYDGWHLDMTIGWSQYVKPNSGYSETGEIFGGGLGGGYTLLIHKNINLEFGAMFWTGQKNYDVFSCMHHCRPIRRGTAWFVMPVSITVGISWVFGNH